MAAEHSQQQSPSAELSIVPFKFAHFEDLIDMHKAQKSYNDETLKYHLLPKIGYIAYLNKQPIAAGFLRRFEPCFAHLDTFVSNPYMGSIIRHQGLELVVDALIAEAKALKLEGILATTIDKGIIDRALKHGFHILPQTIIGLKLT